MRHTNFDNIAVNPEWCFSDARSVQQWTHGYHRYPAKFSPNLVKKLYLGKFSIDGYKNMKSYKIGTLMLPFITRLVQKHALYIKIRYGLSRMLWKRL